MYGCMLAISFLVASYVLSKELKRKEQEGLMHPFIQKVTRGKKASVGELISSFIIAFLIGYKIIYIILHYSNFINDIQGFILSVQGNLIGGSITGIVYTYVYYLRKEKYRLPEPLEESVVTMPHMLIGNITLIAALSGILGAKIFDTFDYFSEFLNHPMQTLLSFSGLTVYGGLLVGAFTVLFYTHKKGIPIIPMVDAAAPAMMIAYSIGRIGCQLSGDGDWGIPNPAPKPHWMGFLPDWIWAFNFPHNVIDQGVPIPGCTDVHCSVLPVPVFPTSFYETVTCAVLFLILWIIRKKIKAPGVLFCIYLVMNGIERFLVEFIRVNIKYHFFGIDATQAQIISSIFFLAGIIGIMYFSKKNIQQSTS